MMDKSNETYQGHLGNHIDYYGNNVMPQDVTISKSKFNMIFSGMTVPAVSNSNQGILTLNRNPSSRNNYFSNMNPTADYNLYSDISAPFTVYIPKNNSVSHTNPASDPASDNNTTPASVIDAGDETNPASNTDTDDEDLDTIPTRDVSKDNSYTFRQYMMSKMVRPDNLPVTFESLLAEITRDPPSSASGNTVINETQQNQEPLQIYASDRFRNIFNFPRCFNDDDDTSSDVDAETDIVLNTMIFNNRSTNITTAAASFNYQDVAGSLDNIEETTEPLSNEAFPWNEDTTGLEDPNNIDMEKLSNQYDVDYEAFREEMIKSTNDLSYNVRPSVQRGDIFVIRNKEDIKILLCHLVQTCKQSDEQIVVNIELFTNLMCSVLNVSELKSHQLHMIKAFLTNNVAEISRMMTDQAIEELEEEAKSLRISDAAVQCKDPVECNEPAELNEHVEFNKPIEFNEPLDINKPVEFNKPAEHHETFEFKEPIEFKEPLELNKPECNNTIESNEHTELNESVEFNKPIELNETIEFNEAVELYEYVEFKEPIQFKEPLEFKKPIERNETSQSDEHIELIEPVEVNKPFEINKTVESDEHVKFDIAIGTNATIESNELVEFNKPVELNKSVEFTEPLELNEFDESDDYDESEAFEESEDSDDSDDFDESYESDDSDDSGESEDEIEIQAIQDYWSKIDEVD